MDSRLTQAQCAPEWKEWCEKQQGKKRCTHFDDDMHAIDADGTDNAMLMTDEATIIRRRSRGGDDDGTLTHIHAHMEMVDWRLI